MWGWEGEVKTMQNTTECEGGKGRWIAATFKALISRKGQQRERKLY